MALSYQTLDVRITLLEDKLEALRMVLLAILSTLPTPPPSDDDSRHPSDLPQ